MTAQKSFRVCTQTKCALLGLGTGCPACPECGAPPKALNSRGLCVNCHCCEGDEGFIRKGDERKTAIIEIVVDQKEVI